MDRYTVDRYAELVMKAIMTGSGLLIVLITAQLTVKSLPIIRSSTLTALLLSPRWYPLRGEFGFYTFIIGTLIVTALAMMIATPISVLAAVYLSEYASRRVRGLVKPLIDILAGIPSVVYGLWGITLIVPIVRYNVAPMFGASTTGYCVLSAAVVLAIMVFPIIISVAEEVLNAVPDEMRETSLALGATKWQTVKYIVLKESSVGMLASVIMGFSRAFGETMAVMMVVGNVAKVPETVFDSAYPLPALIANNYGEMMSLPLYDSALMFTALILLVVVGGFTVATHVLQRRLRGLKR